MVYRKLQDEIRAEIAHAVASNASYRLPTERELQARCGVSRPTVSKALAGLAAEGLLVKPAGCRRFVIAEDVAVRLAGKRSTVVIGLVTGDLSHAGAASVELAHRVFAGMNRAAEDGRCRVLMGSAGPTVATERSAAHDLVRAGAAGLVIWPRPRRSSVSEEDYLKTRELGVPVVVLDMKLAGCPHTQITFDNVRAGRRVTGFLLERGHRRIGLVTMPDDVLHTSVTERRTGYRRALKSAGLSEDPRLFGTVPLEYYAGAGMDTAIRRRLAEIVDGWLALSEPPTAIIALEDSSAMALIEILHDRAVHVPEDIEVVGFDNLEAGRRHSSRFPTTSPDFVRMGELALEALQEEIEDPTLKGRVFLLDVPILVRYDAAHNARLN